MNVPSVYQPLLANQLARAFAPSLLGAAGMRKACPGTGGRGSSAGWIMDVARSGLPRTAMHAPLRAVLQKGDTFAADLGSGISHMFPTLGFLGGCWVGFLK